MTESKDPWEQLRGLTSARVALGRAGTSLPTRAWLEFRLAHAKARDAVHSPLGVEALQSALGEQGMKALVVSSAARDLAEFLRRPDLGRRLAPGEAERLPRSSPDLALVASGGLSATALHRQLLPLLSALTPRLRTRGLSYGPLVLVRHGRVAIGDPIGAAFGAKAVLVLVGERPGLGTPDSLGAYLTFGPREGRSDAERNCVSNNIHAGGLGPEAAADKIVWLAEQALRRQLSGVLLKDEEGLLLGPARD